MHFHFQMIRQFLLHIVLLFIFHISLQGNSAWSHSVCTTIIFIEHQNYLDISSNSTSILPDSMSCDDSSLKDLDRSTAKSDKISFKIFNQHQGCFEAYVSFHMKNFILFETGGSPPCDLE